jgi:hypothetical protein
MTDRPDGSPDCQLGFPQLVSFDPTSLPLFGSADQFNPASRCE